MSRSATAWAYGDDMLKLGLSANELAFLRAICWKYDPRKSCTDPMTNADLTRYTGIKSPQTLSDIRKSLRKRGLIGYAAIKKLPPGKRGDLKTKTTRKIDPRTYVYTINILKLNEARAAKRGY